MIANHVYHRRAEHPDDCPFCETERAFVAANPPESVRAEVRASDEQERPA